jgi:hypothetical protein
MRKAIQRLALFGIVLLLCFCTRERVSDPETAVEAAQTETPASNPEAYYRIPIKYPRIPNAITMMEYPEYRSFIYRYERMRDEQLDLLEANMAQYGLQVDKANSQSLNRAGYALYEKKDYAGAVRFFREAAYVDPSNVYAHYNLACSLSLIRDSIWADPENNMDYHHPFHNDYYVEQYAIYESTEGYFETFDNDEICRNEIFDHLTLTLLQNKEYIEKASHDQDLAGVQQFVRFKRLMDNIKTGAGTEIYGIWYEPENQMKASYFMLDGRMMQIRPDNRPKTAKFFDFYQSEYRNNEYKEYTYIEQTTGYEPFDSLVAIGLTMQWEYKNSQLTLYIQRSNEDNYKLGVPQASSPDKDYKYFVCTIAVDDPDFRTLFLNGNIRLINLKYEPYRYILTGNEEGVKAYIAGHSSYDATTISVLALIAGNADLLDWLLKNAKVSLDELLLRSCMFDPSLFYKLEQGAHGFQFDDFLGRRGLDIFRYAAASGNASFFKILYNKYYETVVAGISREDINDFRRHLFDWVRATSYQEMFDIAIKISEGVGFYQQIFTPRRNVILPAEYQRI